MLKIDDNTTIGEAKVHLREKVHTGFICPCCNQFAKKYKRPLTSAMAYALMLIYKRGGSDFFHVEEYLKEQKCSSSIRGDVPKLRFWDLLEPEGKDKNDGNPANGMYRITKKGCSFVEGLITVQKHVYIYNNKFFGFPQTGVMGIKEALKNRFNYEELIFGH